MDNVPSASDACSGKQLFLALLQLLESLDLCSNRIGDDGMKALGAAIAAGGLPRVRIVSLGGNAGNDAPVRKAIKRRQQGQQPRTKGADAPKIIGTGIKL